MKKIIFSSFLLIAAFLHSFASYPNKALIETKVYKQELSLSESQTKNVLELLSQEINDLRQLQSLRASSMQEYRTKTKETKLEFEMQLSEILNKKQFDYYKSHRREIRDKIKEARLFW